MTIAHIPPHLLALGPDDRMAVLRAARQDFIEQADALLNAVAQDQLEAVLRHRHALSGLCRLFGGDALENAAQRLTRDAAGDEFRQSLSHILAALDQMMLEEVTYHD